MYLAVLDARSCKHVSIGGRAQYDVNNTMNDRPVQSGTSEDALRTMQLVFKIYYADTAWRETYDIPNPDIS